VEESTCLRIRWADLRAELPPMMRLAGPLIAAELGWEAMHVVDTMMLGRLPDSAVAIGASSIANVLFIAVGLFGGGLLFGLDTLVAQSFGANRPDDCRRSLFAGFQLAMVISPLLMGALWLCGVWLRQSRVDPAVTAQAVPYLHAITWSMPFLLLYFAFRRYLQAINLARPVGIAIVSANLVNLAANWLLIYGNLAFPRLGISGSGWATTIARLYMAAYLFAAIVLHARRSPPGLWSTPFRVDLERCRQLLRLGLPAGIHLFLEVAVFAAATVMAGWLGALPLAAHQIALNTVSTTFMVPLGISSAAAVRVGQALGRRDPAGAAQAGWTAIALGGVFMSTSALMLLLIPHAIVRIFTPDPAIIATGAQLLVIAAFFQLFDGIQVITTGALRGAGETRIPMLAAVVCYWLLGLPLGYYLCFALGWGAAGLWVGLSASLIAMGCSLLLTWRRAIR
jgi:MATE family multidrug resistance protein